MNNKSKNYLVIILLIIISGAFSETFSQTSNDILNLLVANKSITQLQADSLRADAAIKQQETDAAKKSFFASAARQIQISGYSQIRYQSLEEKGKKDGFDIRRARLDIRGSLTPYFGYRLQADFADKPKLIDAYAEIKLTDYLIITAGQFKIPLSMENLTSSNKLEMIDRSQVDEALAARGKDVIGNQNGRDIGVQAAGTIFKINNLPFLEYRVGVFNGSGINVTDTANKAKDIAGRLNVNPIKGLTVGLAYYNGYDKAIKPDVNGKSQIRNRFGFDLSYIRPRLSFRGEYIYGQDGKTDRAGWYAQAGYFIIPAKFQILCKYDTYDPNRAIPSNGVTNYVAGANFNFNSWSRIQAFYTISVEQGTQVKNNYLSIQYQIGF